jgi:translation initiation factor 2B subunit (eIF-2B alpha/beta/delta family)
LDALYNTTVIYRDEIIELFRRAASDREQGATEIEVALIRALLAHRTGLRSESLCEGARLLAEGQPVMANLRTLAAAAQRTEIPGSFKTWLVQRFEVLNELPKRLSENAWPHIEKFATVVTISRSSAVAAALEGAWERGWDGSVVVLDGMAPGAGADQARRLKVFGRAISCPDTDVLVWLDVAAAVVLVGADAVGGRRFVNAAGTRQLLELSRHRKVNTVLVADTGKNVGEEMVDEMIHRSPPHRESPDREWPIFEAVPLELVSARVTE